MLFVGLLVTLGLSNCKERDDYPSFDGNDEEEIWEDIIPADDEMSVITGRIKEGAPFFKTFLADSTKVIQSGIEYTHIRFINSLDQKMSMHVVEIDRSKGNFTLQALSPFGDYLYTTSQKLPEMMKMNESKVSGKLVAAITGGSVTSGKPTGNYVQNGRVVATSTSLTVPTVGVRKDNSNIEVRNTYDVAVYPVDAIVPADYSQLIPGTNWMLYYGNEAIYTTTTTVARTSIGFSEDMSKIYLISVDGVENDFSAGIMLNNLRTIYAALDCYSAFYTGGSTSNALSVRSDEAPMGYVSKNLSLKGPVDNSVPYAIAIVEK